VTVQALRDRGNPSVKTMAVRLRSFPRRPRVVSRFALAATIVFVAACAARPPRRAVAEAVPAVPQRLHAEVRDSSVDALPDYRVLVTPDIVLALVDVGADEIVFRLRHRPGSFDSSITRLTIELDTDQNASTGLESIEYSVFVYPAGAKGADVARATNTGHTVVATVPVSFVTDGCDLAIPRSLLGNEDGRFDFRVKVYAQPALPLILDVLPDTGLVRIE
jgi:hypothetical protein